MQPMQAVAIEDSLLQAYDNDWDRREVENHSIFGYRHRKLSWKTYLIAVTTLDIDELPG
jgi:hypothetical protein